jgi:anion-transporting  ArsA/GET3 family ATPase
MKQTFDDMVREYLPDAKKQQALRDNRIYRSMSEALAGVQEYMAVSKLYDVLQAHDYDLVVLDTPPTQHALDFLDAPKRFVDFLDNDALQWLLKSGLVAGRATARLFDFGLGYVVRSLGKIAGIDVLRDIAEFVAAFEPLFHGFRQRAEKITVLLRSHTLGFVVITAPTRGQVDEATFFSERLARDRLTLLATVVNRTHPPLPASALNLSGVAVSPEVAEKAMALGQAYNRLAENEAEQMHRLQGRVFVVEELREDVHSLDALKMLGEAPRLL